MFCDQARDHESSCEHFAEGGEALPDASTLMPVTEAMPDPSTLTPVSGGDLPDASTLIPVEKYESLPQRALTAVEGVASGFAPGVSSYLEKGASKLGLSDLAPEEQANRQRINPTTYRAGEAAGLVASLTSGFGEIPMLGRAVKGGLELAGWAKATSTGSKLLAGAIENGAIAGGDEATKAMLGTGDPENAVGHALINIGGSSLLGLGGAAVGIGLDAAKLGTKLTSFLGGFGAGANPEAEIKAMEMLTKDGYVSQKAFDYGKKAYSIMTGPTASAVLGGAAGYEYDGWKGAFEGAVTAGALGHGPVNAFKLAAPTLLKVMSLAPKEANLGSIARDALDHAREVQSGMSKANKAIDAVFKTGSQQSVSAWHDPGMRKKVQDYIGAGGFNQNIQEELDQQGLDTSLLGFAKGGEVKKKELPEPTKNVKTVTDMAGHLGKVYPEQNLLMNAARGRVSNYLASLRPPEHQEKLAFDIPPDTHALQKTYDTATDIAINPLGIMHEIKNGTIQSQHLQHLNAMYPEVAKVLSQTLTQRITDLQADKKSSAPSLAVRSGLSLFLGTPLSSELKPQNIAAAQASLQMASAAQKAQQEPAPAKGGSKTALNKTSQHLQTGTQSLVARSQRSK